MNKATDVILSGDSAGGMQIDKWLVLICLNAPIGLAVIIGIDDISHQIRNRVMHKSTLLIRGLVDGGFFLDFQNIYKSKGRRSIVQKPSGPQYQYIQGRWFGMEYSISTGTYVYADLMKDMFKQMTTQVNGGRTIGSTIRRCLESKSKPDDG